MKALLIAAGLLAATLGAAPATAAPVGGNAPGIEAPQAREGWHGDRDRRHHGRWDRRGDRWGGNRWGHRGHCRNVRRGHHWVRICGRR